MVNIDLKEVIKEKIAVAEQFQTKWRKKVPRISKGTIILAASCLALVVTIAAYYHISAPASFAKGIIVTVREGESLGEIAHDLEEQKIIRSSFAFKVFTKIILKKDTGIIAGDYVFEKEINAFSVAKRLVTGNFNLAPQKITVPEGLNKFELAELLAEKLIDFNKEAFLEQAPEGYLFPDTYFFLQNSDHTEILDTMTSNFYRKIEPLMASIENSGKDLSDVITMASIIETEARQFETRKMISGILWNRLEVDMPLQVDVAFKYINGKTTFDLTKDDLAIDSPYNTYRYPGLPPTPIANPGLDSITAALEPTETDYFFFLSDNEGRMHYAKTFEEHVDNKELYLY